MTRIDKIVDEGIKQVADLLKNNKESIDEAFRSADEPLTINIKVKIDGVEPTKVKTDVSFTKEKVKDSAEADVFANQEGLPLGGDGQ